MIIATVKSYQEVRGIHAVLNLYVDCRSAVEKPRIKRKSPPRLVFTIVAVEFGITRW